MIPVVREEVKRDADLIELFEDRDRRGAWI